MLSGDCMKQNLNEVNPNDVENAIHSNKVFMTQNSGGFVIESYRNSCSVDIRFVDTGYTFCTTLGSIRRGNIKDKLSPTVVGVGIVGDTYESMVGGRKVNEYKVWHGMLIRCYDSKHHIRQPTYKQCEVSENFKYYPYFYEWANNQIGFNSVDDKGQKFQLDKDLLVKGNKVYSEDVCIFIPQEINSVVSKCDAVRGDSPVGVTYDKKCGKFISRVRLRDSKRVHVGCFDNEIDAFHAYKEAKELYIKEVADKWKDKIDIRAYNALMNYQVEITD